MMQPDTTATLTIDLAAIQSNWRMLAQKASTAECAATIKADGYGLGQEEVADALHQAGCRTFFVAHLGEARRLRRQHRDCRIFVLNGLAAGLESAYRDLKAIPVLGSALEIADWKQYCATSPLPCAVHVDTGMNRLGLRVEDARHLQQRGAFSHLEIDLLMSHLACADQPDHPLTRQQIRLFEEVCELVPAHHRSLANSAATLLMPSTYFDMVRPGIALFGTAPMQPVVRLVAPLLQVRDVPAGESVGYEAAWTARQPRRIATASIGYADGVLRTASGALVSVEGALCPIIGHVSMDLITIDITDAPSSIGRGSPVTLIGKGRTLEALAASTGTIPYELLTRLGLRLQRRYQTA